MNRDITFLGFDDEGVEFLVTGVTAKTWAVLLGAARGVEPSPRTDAVCHVTLRRHPLTHDASHTRIDTAEDDRELHFFDGCWDPSCDDRAPQFTFPPAGN